MGFSSPQFMKNKHTKLEIRFYEESLSGCMPPTKASRLFRVWVNKWVITSSKLDQQTRRTTNVRRRLRRHRRRRGHTFYLQGSKLKLKSSRSLATKNKTLSRQFTSFSRNLIVLRLNYVVNSEIVANLVTPWKQFWSPVEPFRSHWRLYRSPFRALLYSLSFRHWLLHSRFLLNSQERTGEGRLPPDRTRPQPKHQLPAAPASRRSQVDRSLQPRRQGVHEEMPLRGLLHTSQVRKQSAHTIGAHTAVSYSC